MKKGWISAAVLTAAALCLNGCASSSAMSATPSPKLGTTTPVPMISPMAATPEPAPAVTAMPQMSPQDADRMAEKIEEAVERISEVDEAEVIVHGDRALIAVKFDKQYAAGLDDRMKDMVVKAAKEADDGLKEVEVTDDGTLYGQIKTLSERVINVTGLDELAEDFGKLWDRITGRTV